MPPNNYTRKYFGKSYFLCFIGLLFCGACIFAFIFVSKVQSEGPITGTQAKSEKNDLNRIIARLSLEEKLGQLFHIGIEGAKLQESSRRLIQKYKVGGVILFAHNLKSPPQIRKLNRDLQKSSLEASAIPALHQYRPRRGPHQAFGS